MAAPEGQEFDRGMEDEAQETSAASPSLLRSPLKWFKSHPVKGLVGIAVLALAAIPAIVVPMMMSAPKETTVKLVTWEDVVKTLEEGAYPKAKKLARKLKSQESLPPDETGKPLYALGVAVAHEAEDLAGSERTKRYLLASRYLEEANQYGFPTDYRANGFYLLGKSLFECGKMPEARTALLSAVKLNKKRLTEIYSLLAKACAEDSRPKYDQALEYNKLYLSDEKLSPTEKQEGTIFRAGVLLKMNRIKECYAALDEIPASSKWRGAAMTLRGQAMLAEALTNRDKEAEAGGVGEWRKEIEAAIEILRKAQGVDSLGAPTTRQSMYLIGVCFLELKEYKAAAEQFARTRSAFADFPEGVAAAAQCAEIARQAGKDEDMLSDYRRALSGVNDAESYVNQWMPVDVIKTRLTNSLRYYMGIQKYDVALQLIDVMTALFPEEQTLLSKADAHNAWGQALATMAERTALPRRDVLKSQARSQYRKAGDSYSELAKKYPATRQYVDEVWSAATAYYHGQNYRAAKNQLKIYMENEAQRRHPQALAYMGESYLAMNKLEKAQEAFKECYDLYPRDTAASRARLLAARAYFERGQKGDVERAESLLQQNLNGDYLSPASQEWRDSLFALGDMQYLSGKYEEATKRLEEGVKRYPDAPESVTARYVIAESCRESAETAKEKMRSEEIGTSRAAQNRQIRDLLTKALNQYKLVQEKLNAGYERGELSALQRSMLRNSYFSIGSAYFDLGEYERAVQAYQAAANRYQSEPEAMQAYAQIAEAFRRMDKRQEALNALRQAKVVLSRMKPDAPFDAVTNFSRAEWGERLDALSEMD